MSKAVKKGKEEQSIISVRALCEICKVVDTFQIPLKDLLPHIGGLYQVSTIHHCNDNKDMIMNIILDRNFAVRQTSISPFIVEREDTRWSAEKVADIRFFTKQVRDADKAIHAVLSNKTVVVASTNITFTKRIVNTLELFSPVKYPLSEEWIEQVITNKKIIGAPPNIAQEYKNATIVYLDTNKIINGKASLYCKKFLDYLITLEPEGIAQAARLKIGVLVEFAKMIINLSKEPEIGPKAMDLVKMDVSSDALELILDIANGFDPTAIEIIKENWL